MMTTKAKIGLGLSFTAIVGFVLLKGCDTRINRKTADTSLAPNIIEKLVINPDKHTLGVITQEGYDETFLPDRPSSIEINKDGSVTVTSKQWGTELKLFGGFGYSDRLRVFTGVDGFYWKKLDLGVFVSGGIKVPARVGGVVSYAVYSNTRLSLGVDNNKDVALFVSVRL